MKRLNTLALCALLVPAVTLGTSAAFAQTQQQRTTPESAQQQRATQSSQQDRMEQDRSSRGYEGQAEQRQGQAQQQRHLSNKPASAFYSNKLMGADVRSRQDNEDIGTIDELVIDNDGKIVAVIVGVGGFLGMGEREVAIAWDSMDVETDSDGETRFFVNQSREQLKNIPEYSRDGDARSGTTTMNRSTGTTSQSRDAQQRQQQTAAATGTQQERLNPTGTTQQQRTAQQRSEQERTAQQRSEQERSDKKDADKRYSDQQRTAQQRTTDMSPQSQLSTKPANAFHGDKLLNAELRSRPENTKIGSIDELVIDKDGQIVAVIVSAGGFLGMGQRDVAISWDSIQAETDAEGDTRFFVNMTEDQLKNAPKFRRD